MIALIFVNTVDFFSVYPHNLENVFDIFHVTVRSIAWKLRENNVESS